MVEVLVPSQPPGDSKSWARLSRGLQQYAQPHTPKKKETIVFLISSIMKQVLKSPNKSKMINDLTRIIHRRMQTQSITTLDHIEIQILMVFKTVTWNHMKVRRSRIGFNAKNASNTKDTARHFLSLWKYCNALQRRSRSRHGNESTVGSSCTSFDFTSIEEFSKGVDVMDTLQNQKISECEIREEA